MKLTQKLLGYLHRVFDKDPRRFPALRFAPTHQPDDRILSWDLTDGVLSVNELRGGTGGHSFTVDLSQYTIAELVSHIASLPGWTVEYADTSARSQLCALVLIDGGEAGDSGDIPSVTLYGYESLLWSYLEANAVQLKDAEAQVGQMLAQMEIPTAQVEWQDEHGGYYGVRRNPGEPDNIYGPRILVEVLRPRGNNVAIENAVSEIIGQEVTVRDVEGLFTTVPFPLYDGTISYDGAETHNATAIPVYGLFDVDYGYNLLGNDDPTEFEAAVRALIDTLRDAGTHLRALNLQGSTITDAGPPRPTGEAVLVVGAGLTDSGPAPSSDDDLAFELAGLNLDDSPPDAPVETSNINVSYNYLYDGVRTYNGEIIHAGGSGTSGPVGEDSLTF